MTKFIVVLMNVLGWLALFYSALCLFGLGVAMKDLSNTPTSTNALATGFISMALEFALAKVFLSVFISGISFATGHFILRFEDLLSAIKYLALNQRGPTVP